MQDLKFTDYSTWLTCVTERGSARSWPRQGNQQEQANTLAGFHADHALAILDEAGGIENPHEDHRYEDHR